MADTPIRSILIFDDTPEVLEQLVKRLRELTICKDSRFFLTTDYGEAVELAAKRPEMAFIDVYAPMPENSNQVLSELNKQSPETRSLLMTVTGQEDPWFATKAELDGVGYIEKERLLDLKELGDIVRLVREGKPIPWSKKTRKVVSQSIWDNQRNQRRPAKLSPDTLVSIALSFTPREKEWIVIVLNDPEERLTYHDIGRQMKPPLAESGAKEYTERVAKKILNSLNWMERGAVTLDGIRELTERGYLMPGMSKPEFTRRFVADLLKMIGYRSE